MKRSEHIAQNTPKADRLAYAQRQLGFMLGGVTATAVPGWLSVESLADGHTSGISSSIISGLFALGLAYYSSRLGLGHRRCPAGRLSAR